MSFTDWNEFRFVTNTVQAYQVYRTTKYKNQTTKYKNQTTRNSDCQKREDKTYTWNRIGLIIRWLGYVTAFKELPYVFN